MANISRAFNRALIESSGSKVLEKLPEKLDTTELTKAGSQSVEDWVPKYGPVGDVVARTDGVPVAAQKYNVAALRESVATENIINEYVKNKLPATSEASSALQELIEQGQNDNYGLGIWYNDDDLSLMYLPESSKVGYKTWKEVNDAAWMVDNSNLYDKYVKEGYSGSASGLITKEVDPGILKSKDFSRMEIRVNGDEKRKRFNSSNASGDYIKKNYIDKGYHLYEVAPQDGTMEELNYNYILDKDTSKYGLPIRYDVLPYAEGGIRAYQSGEYFVKEGREIYGDGRSYWGVKTLASGDDLAQVRKYADELNKAVSLWNKAKGKLPELQELLDAENFEVFNARTAVEVDKLIRSEKNPDGDLDPKAVAGVYLHNENPANTTGLPEMYKSYSSDSAKIDLLKYSSRYYRKRGSILNDVNGGIKHLERFENVFQKLAQRIAYGRNLEPLLETQGEYYKNHFMSVLDVPVGVDVNKMSGKQLMLYNPVKPATRLGAKEKRLARAASHMQHVMLNLTSTPTKADMMVINFMNDAITSLQGSLERYNVPWWALSQLDRLKNVNPVRAAQALVFHMLLGLTNMSQIWKQPLQIINLMATYPTETMEALGRLSVVLPAYAARHDPSGFDNVIAQFALKMNGFNTDDVKLLVKYMEHYGTFGQVKNRSEIAGTRMLLKALNGLESLNLLPFAKGTDISNLVCDVTAFTLLKNKSEFKLMSEAEKFREIALVSDALNFNATKANTSKLQKNIIGGLMINLMTYTMGTIGAIFGKPLKNIDKIVKPDVVKNGKVVKHGRTVPVRVQLLAALTMLWGLSGITDRDFAPMFYNGAASVGMPQWAQTLLVEGGIGLMSEQLGYSFQEGPEMLAPFKAVIDVIDTIINRQGELPDVPMSNLVPMATGIFGTIKQLVQPQTDVGNVVGFLRRIHSLPKPTSIQNTTAAMYALATGHYINKYGEILKDEMSTWDSALLYFGIKPIEAHKIATAKGRTKLYLDTIDDYINDNIKPLVDEMGQYSNGPSPSADSVIAYSTLKNELEQATADGRKFVQDLLPQLEKTYDRKVWNLIHNYGDRDAATGLSKVEYFLYNQMMNNTQE
jgi:hypothetical protein